MQRLKKTLSEVAESFEREKIEYLYVRYNSYEQTPEDIDILVKSKDFNKVVNMFEGKGFLASSHDQALGGRKKGFQINLVKKGLLKIDLHKDFTWRRQTYIDTRILWKTKTSREIEGIKVCVPDEVLDTLLTLINIIFEKTYILSEHSQINKYISRIEVEKQVLHQSYKFNYPSTLQRFFKWFKASENSNKLLFLPIGLVLYSYWEKLLKEKSFNAISFAYYFFFRSRYLLNKRLPYN